MRCTKVNSYLAAYMDGELSESLRRIVDDHLAGCEVCQVRFKEIREMDALFQSALPVPPVPDGLFARIMAEARKRQPERVPGRYLVPLAKHAFGWIAELSASMRVAACATIILAIVVGLSLNGRDSTGQNVFIEQGKDLYGLEWFAPVSPGSIGSVYIAMAD